MSTDELLRPGLLPVERSSFIGRREQLASARTMLGKTRLLTVLGPGGVGKTRFAIRLADTVRKLYPDGAWFVELSSVGAGGSAADAVATVLGLQSSDRDVYGVICAYLGERRGLLILDNCEHVIDDCAQLVSRILRECGSMTVIATSRTALRISAEDVLFLEPLAVPGIGQPIETSAVRLFLDRCGSLLPEPVGQEMADITEISRRLDGLPLAIELAATRVGTLTPRQILDRLDGPLQLLTEGARDVPNRQQTLHATITWSYELCTESERAMWRRMSVFVGGWDLDAAESMAGSRSGDVLDSVQALVEQSIVQRGESGGVAYYRMLETVRLFGLEMLTDDERARAQEAHRDWHRSRLAEIEADWYGPRQAQWLLLARRDLPNIRAALEFCLSEGDGAAAATLLVTAWRVVWQAHGRFDEFRRWGLRVLDLTPPETPEVCQMMTVVAAIEVQQGDEHTGYGRLSQAEEIAMRLDDPYTRAAIPGVFGAIGSDPESIVLAFTEALELQGGSNLIPARGNTEERLAIAHDSIGNTEIASAMRDSLVARAVGAGERFETSYLFLNAGMNATARNEVENATTLLRQALNLRRELENPVGLAQIEEALASVAAIGSDYSRAASLLGAASTIWNGTGAVAVAFPPLIRVRSEVEEQARRMLGSRAYEAAFHRGVALSIDEGIDFALGNPPQQRQRSSSSRTRGSVLSARESEVAAMVGEGLSDRAIADRLVIARRTAEGHVSQCLTKLGFASRTQLATWAVQELRDESP